MKKHWKRRDMLHRLIGLQIVKEFDIPLIYHVLRGVRGVVRMKLYEDKDEMMFAVKRFGERYTIAKSAGMSWHVYYRAGKWYDNPEEAEAELIEKAKKRKWTLIGETPERIANYISARSRELQERFK